MPTRPLPSTLIPSPTAVDPHPIALPIPSGLAALVSSTTARMAFGTLRDDEDDLYYEKGQATAAFLGDLVSRLFHSRHKSQALYIQVQPTSFRLLHLPDPPSFILPTTSEARLPAGPVP